MKWIVIVSAASFGVLGAGAAIAQEDLAKKDGCMNCHDVSAKKVGPAFKEVAAKYKGKADAEATLFAKLKEGKGHPAATTFRARLAVRVIRPYVRSHKEVDNDRL